MYDFRTPPICTAIVKNGTNNILYNFEFIWLKRPDLSRKIKKLKNGEYKIVGMGNVSRNAVSPLKMFYTDVNNYRHEYTIFEELEGLVRRIIYITILGLNENGGIEFTVDPNFKPTYTD